MELTVRDMRSAVQRALREEPHLVAGGAVFERPLSQRLDGRRFAGLHAREFVAGECPIVDPRLLDLTGETAGRQSKRRQMPHTDRHPQRRPEHVWAIGLVLRNELPVAIERDPGPLVDDGNLHHSVRPGCIHRPGFLARVGSVEKVAPGHPGAWADLAENDSIELAKILERQYTSRALVQVGQLHPRKQRLVADAHLLVLRNEVERRGSEARKEAVARTIDKRLPGIPGSFILQVLSSWRVMRR